MKKLLMVVAMLLVAAVAVSWPFQEPEKVQVPVTVSYGDTLFNICGELKAEYDDKRGIQEIVYYARKQNGLQGQKYIHPGDKLVIEVEKRK